MGAKDGIAMCSNAVGKCYFLLSDWEKSIEYYTDGLAYYNELGQKQDVGEAHYMLEQAYARKSTSVDMKIAKEHFEKALKIYETKKFDN
jgi:tetratricopeptide (TPR) repeat protein